MLFLSQIEIYHKKSIDQDQNLKELEAQFSGRILSKM